MTSFKNVSHFFPGNFCGFLSCSPAQNQQLHTLGLTLARDVTHPPDAMMLPSCSRISCCLRSSVCFVSSDVLFTFPRKLYSSFLLLFFCCFLSGLLRFVVQQMFRQCLRSFLAFTSSAPLPSKNICQPNAVLRSI